MRFGKFVRATNALGVAAGMALALIPAPAQAATNPYTAKEVCGSGYDVLQSHSISGAKIVLMYNGSYNCVVTLKTTRIGKGSYVDSSLTVEGGGAAFDGGTYKYFAGPTKLYGKGHCVSYGGSSSIDFWVSDYGFCK